MNDHRVLNMLGLAKRAGRIIAGEERTLESVRSENAKIVFIANDAGESTAKKIKDKCSYYKIPLIDQFTSHELSLATGASNRVTLSIADPGFSRKLLELIEKGK
ncbi:L7Ae/L30e/S12e/Gadd45 family ribosomal protein [Salinicoccus albus]|uniref:L7Ae/L30e/S12e/Gadd45 family ribosomal protein n=1 Tax=Salinicoccus albus TaxID=418756 RepID=UPI000366258E|nr:ribosomal L7Ae/L30e/S12e/Gadd45 family protein [Salinicoccus albus]